MIAAVMPAGPPVTAPRRPAPAARTYRVVSLGNRTAAPVRFRFRWSPADPWAAFTLGPGEGRYFCSTGGPAAPEVRLDGDPAGGPPVGPGIYGLGYRTVVTASVPGFGDAAHYVVTGSGAGAVVVPAT